MSNHFLRKERLITQLVTVLLAQIDCVVCGSVPDPDLVKQENYGVPRDDLIPCGSSWSSLVYLDQIASC